MGPLALFARRYAKDTGCTREAAHAAAMLAAAIAAHFVGDREATDHFLTRCRHFDARDKAQSNRAPWIRHDEEV